MPTCRGCNDFVTPDFVRVFGTADNEVFHCPACTEMTKIKAGYGAMPELATSEGYSD